MTDGNFTIVFADTGFRTFIGVAKRNPFDVDRPEVGLAIACRRLVANLCYTNSSSDGVEVKA